MNTSATLPPVTYSQDRIQTIYTSQLHFFETGATRSYEFRKAQLKKLKSAIKQHESNIIQALYADLRKPEFEAYGTELGPVYQEINHTLKHLKYWMQPQSVNTPFMFFPSSSVIHPDPLGIVLIIAPWNYPFMLLLSPLISAIAGGNTMIVKPSDQAVHTSSVITKIIQETFDEHYIAAIEGPGEAIGPELIEKYHFDHIFFTGSVGVGKKIMQMAANHLSPVTLELGGKSPCIVDETVNLDFAAKKITWSKFLNAGQTCVAPDYVLVHADHQEKLIDKIQQQLIRMYGTDAQESKDYPRIINQKRFNTLISYLQQGTIIYGGKYDEEDLYIEPTVLTDISSDDAIMHDEIFGPLLPVIAYHSKEEALDIIKQHPYPLALYLYTNNRQTEKFFIENVRFGGGCINNGIIHLGNPSLPFGGVGYSGIGQYHGKYGFDTFARPKSVVKTPTWFDVRLWYAPYKNNVQWLRKFFMK